MRSVLCRVDGGPSVGLGHLQRCLSLAEALRRQGMTVLFLAQESVDVRARVDEAGFKFLSSSWDSSDAGGSRDQDGVIAAASMHGCECVILDSYHIDSEYISAVRHAGFITIVVDDLAAHPFAAHLVVNGAAGSESLPYRSSVGDTIFLLGPNYAPLHTVFWDAPARVPSPTVNRILVTVGGADAVQALQPILRSVDTVPAPFSVTAVIGPFADVNTLESVPGAYCHRLTVARAPHHLRDLMAEADLAVSAGGQTLYELAACGIPTVAVQVSDNQRFNVRCLAAARVVRDGGRVEESDFESRLSQIVTELIGDRGQRARMSKDGRRLVDGRGAARVAEAVAALG
jgi:UDP-2,4-diacetamido-2,4,6-trideoxy-beta-L-altropyranose hydrolase